MSIVAIHRRSAPSPSAAWQQTLRAAVRDPRELAELLHLGPEWAAQATRAARAFGLLVPRPFIARMRPGDPDDPLLRQVLPLEAEMVETPGYVADPVGDAAAALRPGLLKKYRGRALMITTGACAVHCRYCFRRHYPYGETRGRQDTWDGTIESLSEDKSIREIILSGGDPLSLPDETLAELAERLAAVPHLRRLRVHTRLPVMIPERVEQPLVSWLCGTRLTPIVVIHVNHPAEIDAAVASACGRLVDAGIVVLNQAVLLRGVNDRLETLVPLCERLVDLRVMPYYLHQLDRVAGAAHFEVPVARGRALIRELRRRLPGYAVPRYVRERAGAAYKVPLI